MRQTSESYVGLTGVGTPEEAEAAVQIFHAHGFVPGSGGTGMIGVLASECTVNGMSPMNGRHAADIEALAGAFETIDNRVMPMMHLEIAKVLGNTEPFASTLAKLLSYRDLYGKKLCRAVQLNGFPHYAELRALKKDFPHLEVVFQIRKELMQLGPASVLAELGSHDDGALAHALIDPSAGTGTEFDITQAVALYRVLREQRPDLRLGFAGGFSPENTEDRVVRLRAATGEDNWHIDIEGKARDPQTDALDNGRVAGYFDGARRGFDATIQH